MVLNARFLPVTKHLRNNTQYLSSKKAATLCGISVPKFRQWIISGKITLLPVKIGKTVSYSRDEIEEQLQRIKNLENNPE